MQKLYKERLYTIEKILILITLLPLYGIFIWFIYELRDSPVGIMINILLFLMAKYAVIYFILLSYLKIKLNEKGIISIPAFMNFLPVNSFRMASTRYIFYKFHITRIVNIYRIEVDNNFEAIKQRSKPCKYNHFYRKVFYMKKFNADKVICFELNPPISHKKEILGFFNNVTPVDKIFITLDDPDTFIEDVKKMKEQFETNDNLQENLSKTLKTLSYV